MNEANMRQFRSNIKNLAAERGMSVAGLERECNLPAGTIKKWSLCVPAVDKVFRVANALHTSVEDLMDGCV